MRHARWLFALALLGCGDEVTIASPPVDGDLGIEAGSRLRPRVVIADGGAEAFVGWHDRLLEVDCAFRPTADGKLRCLPVTPRVVFTDPECTLAAWVETPCFFDYRYAGLGSPPDDPCRNQSEAYPTMYRRMPGSLADDAYYMASHDGLDCSAMPVPLAPGEVLVPAEPVPLDTFVAAEDEVVSGDGRLGRVERHADDGAIEVIAAHDAAYDRSCSPNEWFGDGERCIVDATAGYDDTRFADEACTVATTRTWCGEVIARRAGESCGGPQLFEIGEAIDTVYADGGGACAAESASDTQRVGRELFSEDFPQVGVREEGKGRLRARYPADPSGWRVAPNLRPLFDSELGVSCEVPRERGFCAPVSGGFEAERFADPGCSEPVFVLSQGSCLVWDWMRVVERDEFGCAQTAAHRPVLEPDPSLVTYAEVDGSCVETPLDEGDVAYHLGPPHPTEDLAAVRVEIR